MNWILLIPGYFLALLRALFLIILMILFILVYLIGSLIFFKHDAEKAFKLRHIYLVIAIPVLGIKIDKKGDPIDEVALYVCNHRSFSDPVILCYFLEAYVIAKAEIASYPIINKGAAITGVIYVKREKKDSRRATRETMLSSLKGGLNILVYPEGTTNALKYPLQYRPGTFIEIAKNNIPVVPVALEHFDIRHSWVDRTLIGQYFLQFSRLRTYAKLEFGPKMYNPDGLKLRDQVESWTCETIDKMHLGWGSDYDQTRFKIKIKDL